MDPVSALRATLAMALFPGAGYLAVVGWAAARAGRLPRCGRPARIEEAVAALAVAAACGLLAFPGSPLNDLPVAVSLGAVIVALSGAVAWGSSAAWNWRRVVAAVVVLAPLLCLGESAASLNVASLAVLPGRPVAAARIFAAAAVLIALPLLIRPFEATTSRLSRSALLAGSALLALSLIVAGPLGNGGGAIAAGLCAGAAIVYAALLSVIRTAVDVDDSIFAGLAAIPASGSILLTLLSR
jgi:hypothetical protein